MEPVANVTDSEWERVFSVNTVSVMPQVESRLNFFCQKSMGLF
nr:hypothetical protein [Oenococcus oeni]